VNIETIAMLAPQIARGERSPVELMETMLNRIDASAEFQ